MFLRSCLCFFFLLAPGSLPALGSVDLARVVAEAEAPRLTAVEGYRLENVALEIGLAKLTLHDAVLVPAQAIAGRTREFVLLGSATLVLEPPTEVEAHQLRLFTGRRSFREAIEEAVFVLSNESAVTAIENRATVQLGEEDQRRAVELFSDWRTSGERRRLLVDSAIVREVVGDPGADRFFAGWFDSDRLGRFLYRVDPWQREQASLGQFVPIDLTAREEKKLRRYIHKQQRRDRLVNLELSDLGTWNTWVEESLRVGDQVAPGSAGWEPVRYEIDASIDPRQGVIEGTVELELAGNAMAGRAVTLFMDPNVDVEDVRRISEGEPGPPLLTVARGADLVAFLDEDWPEGELQGEAAAGDAAGARLVVLRIAFRSELLERMAVGGMQSFYLDSTLYWYPHVGSVDLATYRLRLEWPKKFEVLAPGRREGAEARERGRRAATWSLDRASFGVTFELGEYKTYQRKIGDLDVTLALDEISAVILNDTEVLFDYIEKPLIFLQDVFGDLPYEGMTFVTAPREFSQSLNGFVTLSTLMMTDDASMYLLGSEDPRTVIAHEIAHQWWGHRVGWLTDRDQWLSESLADYSAELYARRGLVDLGGWSSPTTGWRDEMEQPVAAFRLGDLGPVTMGARLNSSLTDSAYSSIAYKKGAVVLQMLARRIGEDDFNRALAKMAEWVDWRPISTAEVVEYLERSTGVDLESFSADFIYGTRMPEFTVSYEVRELTGEGEWQIDGRVRMERSLRPSYRVVRTQDAETALDVERGWVEQEDQTFTSLVVPVRIRSAEPQANGGTRHVRAEEGATRKTLGGLFRLDSQSQEFSLPVQFEPETMTFDPDDQVYATFRQLGPAAGLLQEGRRALAVGERDQALQHFRAATITPGLSDVASDDVHIDARLELARLLIGRREFAEAEDLLEQVRDLLERDSLTEWLYEVETSTQEARILLHQGRARAALKKLDKADEIGLGIEGSVLRILAAREVNAPELAARLLERNRVELSNVVGAEELTP